MKILQILPLLENKVFSLFSFLGFSKQLAEGQLKITDDELNVEDFINQLLISKIAIIKSLQLLRIDISNGQGQSSSMSLFEKFSDIIQDEINDITSNIRDGNFTIKYEISTRKLISGKEEIVKVNIDYLSTSEGDKESIKALISENEISYLTGMFTLAAVVNNPMLISADRQSKLSMLSESSISRLVFSYGNFIVEDGLIKFRCAVVDYNSGINGGVAQ